ncbi:RDD family protein [Nonomuraea sp. NPDC050536]|uniref:RDD family protein n=1 Tax=Nonomuraea sp. NPDC050536 TaxID=3364366 RepID=UPI0037C6AAF9
MSEVVTGDAVVVEVRVAQLPSRAVALVIDLAVQVTVMVVAFMVLEAFAIVTDAALFAAISIVVMVLVMVGYPVLFETLTRGRSLGKLALGLRVVGDDGSPERFRQALFRGLAGLVEFWLLYGAPALISSLVSQRGKRLGDIFAGTIVISDRAPVDRSQAIQMPPPLAAWASTLELSQLPDEVAAAARQYLMRWYDLAPMVQHEMGSRIAAQVAATVSPAPPPGVPPHAFLSAVLAERRRRDEVRLAARNGHHAPPQAPNRPTAPYAPSPGYAPQPQYAPPPGYAPSTRYPPPAPQPVPPAAEPPRTTPGGFAPPQ